MEQRIIIKRNDVVFENQYNKLSNEGWVVVRINGSKYIFEKQLVEKLSIEPATQKPASLSAKQIARIRSKLLKAEAALKRSTHPAEQQKLKSRISCFKAALN